MSADDIDPARFETLDDAIKWIDDVLFAPCTSHEWHLYAGTNRDGRRVIIKQCALCYLHGGFVSKHSDGVPEWDALSPFNPDARLSWWRERNDAVAKCREHFNHDWRQKYAAYILSSDKWARKRAAVLARDRGICQSCLEAKATAVHHLTYKHLFDEPLFDLVAVCQECHDRIHGIGDERERT